MSHDPQPSGPPGPVATAAALAAPARAEDGAGLRALRTIAGFEALKGMVALIAGVGVLGLLHRDLHRIAAALIGHVGLSPGEHYPALLLAGVDRWSGHGDWQLLTAMAAAYALLRFTEAYGLWHDRAWGEWLGALSGALYIPFELWHWAHRPTVAATAVIAINAAVIVFLGWQLRTRRTAGIRPA